MEGKGVILVGRQSSSLKKQTIVKLAIFYWIAIKDNVLDVGKRKMTIFALLMHYSSSDDSPKHGKCPKGKYHNAFINKALSQIATLEKNDKNKNTYI
ncbi:hypothetical protein CEXT_731921 [Caerostris extrusa]|uniref:Uncharacterized protein n=1 Tax=Caerostris extrusa TaxID=172846 RepID=A0AAV4QCJ5_CAEEX|nr:hypothetical protein CEXT_731921 [Caerostris extrusa]